MTALPLALMPPRCGEPRGSSGIRTGMVAWRYAAELKPRGLTHRLRREFPNCPPFAGTRSQPLRASLQHKQIRTHLWEKDAEFRFLLLWLFFVLELAMVLQLK